MRPFDRNYLLTSFKYWLKETVFERRLRLKSLDPLFTNLHCVDFFDILPARRRELFVKGPER